MGFGIFCIEDVMSAISFFIEHERILVVEVFHGKGRQRRKPSRFYLANERELDRLVVFLSEKSLTHNLSEIGGEGNGVLKMYLRESERAILNSNIDADMLQTIVDCLSKELNYEEREDTYDE